MEIAWHPWTNATFDRAADEGKLILLSISAVWCHWCHVMDSTTYKDEAVIKLLNDNFICVRADVDCDPEIANRYNLGGFPTTAFLTSSGLLIDGGTYIPPDVMAKALQELIDHIKTTKVIPVRSDYAQFIKAQNMKPAEKLPEDAINELMNELKPMLDQNNGGFLGAPKFPSADFVRLLWAANEDELAEKTLNGMAKLHDEEGGFYRYATEQDWTSPHYEKLLTVNADLLKLYNEAYNKTKNESYKNIVEGTLNFILNTLKQEKAFGGSQDADEAYYRGNREGEKPKVDPFIYTDANAKTISALLSLERDDATKQALEALDWILDHLLDEKLFHYYDKEKSKPGIMQDYAYLITALLDAAEHTKEGKYLEKAEHLAKQAIHLFYNNGFKDYDTYPNAIGYLKDPLYPLVENTVIATALDRLARVLKNKDYAQHAKRTLLRHANQYKSYRALAAPYALAVHQVLK